MLLFLDSFMVILVKSINTSTTPGQSAPLIIWDTNWEEYKLRCRWIWWVDLSRLPGPLPYWGSSCRRSFNASACWVIKFPHHFHWHLYPATEWIGDKVLWAGGWSKQKLEIFTDLLWIVNQDLLRMSGKYCPCHLDRDKATIFVKLQLLKLALSLR